MPVAAEREKGATKGFDIVPRVLVVDDDPDMLVMVKRVISRKCRCELETATSGEEALERLEQWRPQLVITDIKMPGLDGLALLKLVRERVPDTTVIMMTGYGTVEMAVEALREGAYDFIEKHCCLIKLQRKSNK